MNVDQMQVLRECLEPAALSKSMAHFARPKGSDLLLRTERFFAWQGARRRGHVWPTTRSLETKPGATTQITDVDGRPMSGLNFASQDYLSLCAHSRIHEAALRALRDFGPHSAGSPCLLGNTTLSLKLERELCDFLQMEHMLLFPTGWGAGFGVIAGLVRPSDFIVIDELAHACLQQGAMAATGNIVRHKHLDIAAVRKALREIRAFDTENGILVVTEGLFSMNSDSPSLAPLQESCREFNATLLVDVAHDLGARGPGGTSHIGREGLLGKVDLVMGSFSKTFASNGGFVASHTDAVKQYIKHYGGPHIFSNALSPVQAAIVSEALEIVRSPEGDALRESLLAAVVALRSGLARGGISCYGDPSAIVGVPIGNERLARISGSLLNNRGVIANIVEFPAVAVGAARYRMQVMARHTVEQAEQAAAEVLRSLADGQRFLESWSEAGA